MSDILDILTEEEKVFIKEHNLSPSDFYDARGEHYKDYHDNAKMHGCCFVIYNKCQNGHRLRTRSGHCIICSPRSIAFQKRESGKGVVYIARNGIYCKVGMIENKRKTEKDLLEHRENQLNSEDGYGEMIGWNIVKSWSLDKNAGKVEREAHFLLREYKVEKLYWYSGELRTTNELFKCSLKTAEEAVLLALDNNQT
jgi:hypothetical protein